MDVCCSTGRRDRAGPTHPNSINTKMSLGFETTAQEAAATFADEIKGKNVLITGATPGSLGAEAARVIAKYGANVLVLAGRNRQKLVHFLEANRPKLRLISRHVSLEDTAKALKDETPAANIKFLDLDLASFASVRKAADEVNSSGIKINVLLNNSGIMAPPYRVFEGLESQFVTNHVGHYLFTNLIMDNLLSSGPGVPRVINVTSVGHTISGMQFDDINFGDGANYHAWKAYGQSKTANILFTRSLAAKYSGKLLSYSVHPGVITT